MGAIKTAIPTMAFYVLFCIAGSHAQDAVLPSGGNASGIAGSSSYSVGLVLYKNITCIPTAIDNCPGSVAYFVQHPFELAPTGVEEEAGHGFFIKVFPNPASSELILKTDDPEWANLILLIHGPDGKLIREEGLAGLETTVSLGTLRPGMYMLSIADNSRVLKTYKIIKNQ